MIFFLLFWGEKIFIQLLNIYILKYIWDLDWDWCWDEGYINIITEYIVFITISMSKYGNISTNTEATDIALNFGRRKKKILFSESN